MISANGGKCDSPNKFIYRDLVAFFKIYIHLYLRANINCV